MDPAAFQIKLNEARTSLRVLFPGTVPPPSVFVLLGHVLDSMRADLGSIRTAANALDVLPDAPDTLAHLDELASALPPGKTFGSVFDEALLDSLSERFPEPSPGLFKGDASISEPAFFFAHAKRLAASLASLIPDFLTILEENRRTPCATPDRVRPVFRELAAPRSVFGRMNGNALGLELETRAEKRNPFASGRVYRHVNGEFLPLKLESIRHVDDFYGYHDARKTFLEHFQTFSEGKSNLPLLISSLPGLGKTQMTIAYTLFYPNLILILPAPGDISGGLEKLVRTLGAFPQKKFMLFFDDIDAAATDWYSFRANVGGTYSLPANVSITIASNQRFPANISSRGRGFVFPMFDEVRCQEMISDFLISKGMKNPAKELVAVIASDYVEEFGQKLFEELSPRTLVRYLQVYDSDPVKRRKMLENSKNELITEPDSQVFYDENVKLMRSLYGDEVLAEFREKEYHVS